jgi:hypothetical protein
MGFAIAAGVEWVGRFGISTHLVVGGREERKKAEVTP